MSARRGTVMIKYVRRETAPCSKTLLIYIDACRTDSGQMDERGHDSRQGLPPIYTGH